MVRDTRVLGNAAMESLQREQDEAREGVEGEECWMKLVGFNGLKEGDVLENDKREELARTLERPRSDPMQSRRTQKAAQAIREVVSMAILTEMNDPRVQDVTVTQVEVTPDMRQAKVHVSIRGSETKTRL